MIDALCGPMLILAGFFVFAYSVALVRGHWGYDRRDKIIAWIWCHVVMLVLLKTLYEARGG